MKKHVISSDDLQKLTDIVEQLVEDTSGNCCSWCNERLDFLTALEKKLHRAHEVIIVTDED